MEMIVKQVSNGIIIEAKGNNIYDEPWEKTMVATTDDDAKKIFADLFFKEFNKIQTDAGYDGIGWVPVKVDVNAVYPKPENDEKEDDDPEIGGAE